jgi:hypothetical protein
MTVNGPFWDKKKFWPSSINKTVDVIKLLAGAQKLNNPKIIVVINKTSELVIFCKKELFIKYVYKFEN